MQGVPQTIGRRLKWRCPLSRGTSMIDVQVGGLVILARLTGSSSQVKVIMHRELQGLVSYREAKQMCWLSHEPSKANAFFSV